MQSRVAGRRRRILTRQRYVHVLLVWLLLVGAVTACGGGGTGAVQLTTDPAVDAVPAFSPDGSDVVRLAAEPAYDGFWWD